MSSLGFSFDLAPTAGAVVGDDLSEYLAEGTRVDGLVLAYRHHTAGLVVVAAGDDALGVGNDRSVVQEDIDVILRGQ